MRVGTRPSKWASFLFFEKGDLMNEKFNGRHWFTDCCIWI